MLLAIHIFLAISGYVLMFGALIGKFFSHQAKSDNFAQASFGCFIGLIATGTVLVIAYHASMLGACKEGLSYFIGLGALYIVYRKMISVSSD